MSLDLLWGWIGKASIIHECGEWRLRVCLVESELGRMENDGEKMCVWLKVKMRKLRKWQDLLVFSLAHQNSLSPTWRENTSGKLFYVWTKLSQSNIHIIWTSMSFPSKLFCLLLSFVVLSLIFLFYLNFRFFPLPFCAYP